MADPRCQGCSSLLRWMRKRYYCPKCKEFADAIRDDLRRAAGVGAVPEGYEKMRGGKPVSHWRDDALEAAAQIVERYQADPWIARDIRAMKSPDGVKGDA